MGKENKQTTVFFFFFFFCSIRILRESLFSNKKNKNLWDDDGRVVFIEMLRFFFVRETSSLLFSFFSLRSDNFGRLISRMPTCVGLYTFQRNSNRERNKFFVCRGISLKKKKNPFFDADDAASVPTQYSNAIYHSHAVATLM